MRLLVFFFKGKPSKTRCGVTRLACRDAPWRVRLPRYILICCTFVVNADAFAARPNLAERKDIILIIRFYFHSQKIFRNE